MSATLEIIEQRLEALEREVVELRRLLSPAVCSESPAERGARLLREAAGSQGVIEVGFARALKEMGIEGTAIGAENLRQRLAAAGFKAADNEMSRGIIGMREE
jgi:hypothetical protein